MSDIHDDGLPSFDANLRPQAIERAHRRQAVVLHRRGIFRLEKRLRRMAETARKLVDPEYRRRDAEQRALAQAALFRLPPSDDRARARRLGRRLHEARAEIGAASIRASFEAVCGHAEAMRRVADEHDRHEALRKRALARRAFWSTALRLSLLATLVGVALYVWTSH